MEGARGQSPGEGRPQHVSRAALKNPWSLGCGCQGQDGEERAKAWAELWEGRWPGRPQTRARWGPRGPLTVTA